VRRGGASSAVRPLAQAGKVRGASRESFLRVPALAEQGGEAACGTESAQAQLPNRVAPEARKPGGHGLEHPAWASCEPPRPEPTGACRFRPPGALRVERPRGESPPRLRALAPTGPRRPLLTEAPGGLREGDGRAGSPGQWEREGPGLVGRTLRSLSGR